MPPRPLSGPPLEPRGLVATMTTWTLIRRTSSATRSNDVVLNQVLVRLQPPGGGDADAFTQAVIARVQEDGTCWLGGSLWKGRQVMRISISGWNTSEDDVDRSVETILRCAARA